MLCFGDLLVLSELLVDSFYMGEYLFVNQRPHLPLFILAQRLLGDFTLQRISQTL